MAMNRVSEGVPLRRVEYTNILATLAPFVEALDAAGIPYRPALVKAGLPTEIEDPLQRVETRRLVRFTHQASYQEGLPHLGMLAALRGPVTVFHPRILGRIENSPSLLTALKGVCGLVHLQSSSLHVWMDLRPHQLRVCHATLVSGAQPGAEHFEIVRTVRLITIIERFLGPGWRPSRIELVMPRLRDPLFEEWLGGTAVRTGAPFGMIPIPIQRLGDDCAADAAEGHRVGPAGLANASSGVRLDVLEAVLASRLAIDVPTIEMAAEMLGVPVRTLQRRFAEAGTNYREFLTHLRYRAARHFLLDTDMTIREVAERVGYTDASNLARTVRRIAGLAPAELRARNRDAN